MELLNLFLTFLYVPLNYYAVKCESYKNFVKNHSVLNDVITGDAMCGGTNPNYDGWDSISKTNGWHVFDRCGGGVRSVEENCFYYFYSLRIFWLTHLLQSEFPGVPFHLPNTFIDTVIGSGYDCDAEFDFQRFSQIRRMMLEDISPLHKYLGQVCQDMKEAVFRAPLFHFRISPLAVFACFKKNTLEQPVEPPDDIGKNLLNFMEIALYEKRLFRSPIFSFAARFEKVVDRKYCCLSYRNLTGLFCTKYIHLFKEMYAALTVVPWLPSLGEEYNNIDECHKRFNSAVKSYKNDRKKQQLSRQEGESMKEMMFSPELGFPYTHNRLVHKLQASIMCQTMMYFGYREGRKHISSENVSYHGGRNNIQYYEVMMNERFSGDPDRTFLQYEAYCDTLGDWGSRYEAVITTGFTHLDLAIQRFLSCVKSLMNQQTDLMIWQSLEMNTKELISNYNSWCDTYARLVSKFETGEWTQLWLHNNRVMIHQNNLIDQMKYSMQNLGLDAKTTRLEPFDSQPGVTTLRQSGSVSFYYYVNLYCRDFKLVTEVTTTTSGSKNRLFMINQIWQFMWEKNYNLILIFWDALYGYYAFGTATTGIVRPNNLAFLSVDPIIAYCLRCHLTDFIAMLSYVEHQVLGGVWSSEVRVLTHLFDFLVLYNCFRTDSGTHPFRTAIGLYEMAEELNAEHPDETKLRRYLQSAKGFLQAFKQAPDPTKSTFGTQASTSAWYFSPDFGKATEFVGLKDAEDWLNEMWPSLYEHERTNGNLPTFRETATQMGLVFDPFTPLTLKMLIARRFEIRSAFYRSANLGTDNAVEFEFFLY